jgi:phage FluMu protein Com
MEEQKLTIEERVRNFARAIKEGTTPQDSFEYETTAKGLSVKAEGKTFDVTGDQRMSVKPHKEVKPAKAKGVKKAPAEDAEVKCSKCGKPFVRSRFNPYMDKCRDCRKGALQATGEQKICKKCGKKFTPSKFNPYLETCPECRATKRKAGRPAKPAKAKKSAKAKPAKKGAKKSRLPPVEQKAVELPPAQ